MIYGVCREDKTGGLWSADGKHTTFFSAPASGWKAFLEAYSGIELTMSADGKKWEPDPRWLVEVATQMSRDQQMEAIARLNEAAEQYTMAAFNLSNILSRKPWEDIQLVVPFDGELKQVIADKKWLTAYQQQHGD